MSAMCQKRTFGPAFHRAASMSLKCY